MKNLPVESRLADLLHERDKTIEGLLERVGQLETEMKKPFDREALLEQMYRLEIQAETPFDIKTALESLRKIIDDWRNR